MKSEFINAEDESRTIRIEGHWFLPPADNQALPSKVAGVLTFTTAESAKLELFGQLDGVSTGCCEIPVIWGLGVDGSKITIFSAVTSGVYGSPSYWRMACDMTMVWVSEFRHYRTRGEVVFDEFVLGINRLRAWDGRNGYVNADLVEDETEVAPDSKSNRTDVQITYRHPDDVLFYDDEHVSICLSYWWSQSGWCIEQGDAYIKDYPRIVIKGKNSA